MKKITTAMVALGVASCAGVSLLPLGSASAVVSSKQVQVTLASWISLAVSSNDSSYDSTNQKFTFSLDAGGSTVQKAATLSCGSNSSTGYSVIMQSTSPDNDANHTTAASRVASLVSGGDKIVSSTAFEDSSHNTLSAYAVKTAVNSSDWQVVPASNGTPLSAATSSGVGSNNHTITWGFSAAANQPTGTYSDTVAFTIATNNS